MIKSDNKSKDEKSLKALTAKTISEKRKPIVKRKTPLQIQSIGPCFFSARNATNLALASK